MSYLSFLSLWVWQIINLNWKLKKIALGHLIYVEFDVYPTLFNVSFATGYLVTKYRKYRNFMSWFVEERNSLNMNRTNTLVSNSNLVLLMWQLVESHMSAPLCWFWLIKAHSKMNSLLPLACYNQSACIHKKTVLSSACQQI